MFKKIIQLFICTTLFFCAQTAFAQTEFKLATFAPDGTPWSVLLKKINKQIAKESNQALKGKVYLGGVKGDEQAIVRQINSGALQMGGVSSGAIATIAKDMDILELPYAFANYEEVDRVMEQAKPLIEQILEQNGFKLLIYSENGYRNFASKSKCISSPADLKAVKMRSQESEVHLETYRALDASPVPISGGEVMSSLQTGVVDGFDNTALITQATGWNQAIKYFSLTEHIYQPAFIIANKAWFDALPKEHQDLFINIGKTLEKDGKKMVRDMTTPLLDNFKEQGITICDLTDDQKKAFKQKTAGVWDKKYAKSSDLGKKLIDLLRKK